MFKSLRTVYKLFVDHVVFFVDQIKAFVDHFEIFVDYVKVFVDHHAVLGWPGGVQMGRRPRIAAGLRQQPDGFLRESAAERRVTLAAVNQGPGPAPCPGYFCLLPYVSLPPTPTPPPHTQTLMTADQ